MSIGAHLLGLAMFAAGPVTGQKGQILIAHDEMDRCLGNNSPNLHSVPGGEIAAPLRDRLRLLAKTATTPSGSECGRSSLRSAIIPRFQERTQYLGLRNLAKGLIL